MRTAILVALVLVGCTVPSAAPTLFSMQIDPSACEAASNPDGAPVPTFDGAMWHLGESTAALRCPIPVQLGDVLTEWIVFVQRAALGPATTARMQALETVSGLHVDVGAPVTDGTTPGPYVPIATTIPPTFITDDDTFSLLVTGNGKAGDRVGASIVYGLRE
jgi:hypothetical protein